MAEEDRAAHGFDVDNLDRTCKPCDDFRQFAVGGWLKNNPIPAQYPVWGSFITLADKNQEALRGILESTAANSSATAGSNEQKIGDFYASCMDTKEIDAQGLKPIGAELAAIEAIRDTGGLLDTGARLQTQGVGVLFTFGSDQDFKDSSKVIGEANQGGLTLPDRDYYTRDDEESKKLRQQFAEHLSNRAAGLLSDPFVQENFAFNGRILTGSKEIRPRWKRCTIAADQQLGEALGQIYVQKYFPPEAKARALELVHNLLAALRDDLQTLPWMSPATRKAAIEKLEAFTIKIGYPDKWRDYWALEIDLGPSVCKG